MSQEKAAHEKVKAAVRTELVGLLNDLANEVRPGEGVAAASMAIDLNIASPATLQRSLRGVADELRALGVLA